ncbi:MAG: cytochrome c3 family protein [Calditrichia bacterium]
MKKFIIILAIISSIFVFCSEQEKPTQIDVKTHPENWLAVHGTAVLDSNFTIQSCQSCHGQDYAGGNSTVACTECHTFPHLASWMNPKSNNFHGIYVKDKGLDACIPCHGADFKKDDGVTSCYACHTFPHLSSWINQESDQFHGEVFDSKGPSACQPCHGEDFGGGTSGLSCYTCHTFPHLNGWDNPESDAFHGKVAQAQGNQVCQPCHGEDFGGGTSGVSCYSCHTYPHLEGWMDLSSSQFHGEVTQEKGNQACQGCHGQDFKGGVSGVSCYTCHTYPHPDGFIGGTVHGAFIKNELDWDLTPCKECHGVDYYGGLVTVGLNCRACHTEPAGPEACNTCHGDFNNPDQIAPPRDLDGNFSTTAIGVGAHQNHTTDPIVTNPYGCTVCHPSITQFSQDNHIDNVPGSTIIFNSFATQNGTLDLVWNSDQATCSNSYCHGSFVFKKSDSQYQFMFTDSIITGIHEPVVWTQVAATPACDFCHQLPPAGHLNDNYTVNDCARCHYTVVDASGNIIDKSKHINGKANVFGN